MKNTLIVLLSGLLLCGYSQNQAVSLRPAIDYVEAGKFVTWHDGTVSYVQERDGNSLKWIKITWTGADGLARNSTTAETGTLKAGSVENPADDNAVRITLQNPQFQCLSGANTNVQFKAPELMLVLRK
jgi:hypothetical protein